MWGGISLVFVLVAVAVVGVLAWQIVHALSYHGASLPEWEEAVLHFQNSEKVPVVVSLTTMPGRLSSGRIQQTLKSVMMQNPGPERIEINIPYELRRKGTKYHVPSWLQDSPVHIFRGEDEGPATKYLPTLRRYAETQPDAKIFVIDDDMIMPHGLIDTVNDSMNAHPHKALCGHGNVLHNKGTRNVSFDLNSYVEPQSSFLSWLSWNGRAVDTEKGFEEVDIITGYNGYAIRPSFFDLDQLSDYSDLPEGARYVDDIVISARLAQRRVPRIVSQDFRAFKFEEHRLLEFVRGWLAPSPDTEDLSSTENKTQTNNDRVVKHFWAEWNNVCAVPTQTEPVSLEEDNNVVEEEEAENSASASPGQAAKPKE